MVYDAGRFDALTDTAWDDERVRDGIRAIVADADAAFDETLLWPADDWDAWQTPTPLKSLYVGAAGVIWALDALARRGVAETDVDLPRAARRTLDPWLAEPDPMRGTELPQPARAGFLTGQAGILRPWPLLAVDRRRWRRGLRRRLPARAYALSRPRDLEVARDARYPRPFCFAIAPASRSPVMNMWAYACR